MTGCSFSLVPFESASFLASLGISGLLQRRDNVLSISYELKGSLEETVIPPQVETPERRNRLWESTCFELFVAPQMSEQYWEFNFSPAGHWNVYHFSHYRTDMEEEQAFTALPFVVRTKDRSLHVDFEADIDRIVSSDSELMAGVSAVIKGGDGSLSYWALSHPGDRPDFHRRESFLIRL